MPDARIMPAPTPPPAPLATVRLASAIYAQGVLVEASGSRATVWDGGRCWEGERVTP